MSERPPAARLPTLEDVAQVAGVSRATVSRVINGVRNVDPQLHAVVWRAVDQTGYVPNRTARSLVTRSTGSVALVVSGPELRDDDPYLARFFSDPYFGRVVGGLMSVLRPADMQLTLQVVGSDDARARLVGDLRHGHDDGVIVLSLAAGDALPRMLADAGIAAVMIGRPVEPVPISYVDITGDTEAAFAVEAMAAESARLLLDHIHDLSIAASP
jgi:DNA-binding LacI/PurR family transcriptional regulator